MFIFELRLHIKLPVPNNPNITCSKLRLDLIAVAASTVEYLPAMIHLNSKPGLLPTFPSWSLICLGPSSVYSHNHGLREMPNFTHGSGYLLMCDVQLKVDLQKWREQAESLPGTTKKRYSGKSVGSVNVKLFVGLEYECLRGHRFTLQAADRILKQPPGIGGPKDSYTALLHNDMPLWFPCPCRYKKFSVIIVNVQNYANSCSFLNISIRRSYLQLSFMINVA